MRTIVIILGFVLASCGSPQALLKRAIERGAKVTIDTVYRDIAVIVPEVRHDSIFTSLPGDTVTITKDRLQVKYVKLAGEKVYIEGICLPDTVRVEVPVAVTTTIEAGYSWWDVLKWCLFTAVLVGLGSVFYFGYWKSR